MHARNLVLPLQSFSPLEYAVAIGSLQFWEQGRELHGKVLLFTASFLKLLSLVVNVVVIALTP